MRTFVLNDNMMMRPILILSCLLALAGCGGGGGGGDDGEAASPTSVVSCGAPSGATGSDVNVLPVSVKTCGVVSTVNMPYVDVTICAPGSTTDCKTIGYVLVDTGSYGLRIFASAVDSLPTLPQQTEGGDALVECRQFASSYMWGNVRRADIRLGGLTARDVPMQVVGDSAAPNVPSACASTGTSLTSARAIGANGILGIGAFIEDDGPYFRCSGSGCAKLVVSPASPVRNPVAALSTDNNGVLLDMNAVASTGAATGSGSLILGIGTRSNNALGSAVPYDLNSSGQLRTTYNGNTIFAIVDSGSAGLFFDDATLATCGTSAWYCPSMTQSRSATILGATNAASSPVNFQIANANSLFDLGNRAYNNLGGEWGGSGTVFDWGMPFFYGRPVFTAIDGRSTPKGMGPYVAF